MASTHTARTLKSSASLSAATNVDGTEWDNSAAYGGFILAKVTIGGTAPNADPIVIFYQGHATTVKNEVSRHVIAGPVAGTVYLVKFPVEVGAMFLNITFQNSGDQAITVEAFAQELTTI